MTLLDTHVLVWFKTQPRYLSKRAASALRRAETARGLAISVITLVELSGLLYQGRLRLQGSLDSTIRQLVHGISILPITFDVAILSASFPADFPSDAMDRIIAATARAENMALVTADERILQCSLIKTIW